MLCWMTFVQEYVPAPCLLNQLILLIIYFYNCSILGSCKLDRRTGRRMDIHTDLCTHRQKKGLNKAFVLLKALIAFIKYQKHFFIPLK